MFRLRDLISLDDQYSSEPGLKDCFGDRYLCERNTMFRAVRRMFLSRGGSYRDAGQFDLGRRYLIAPLLCLSDILETSVIPYKANAACVEAVAATDEQFGFSGLFLISPNYLMHETAHCVSYGLGPASASSSPERLVAEAICSEAFANTIERLATADVTAPTDAIFFLMNSYGMPVKHVPVIRAALDRLGFSSTFSLAMTGFACANLSPDPPSVSVVVQFLAGEGLLTQDSDEGLISTLLAQVFRLQAGFQENTSLTYFRMLGLEGVFRTLKSQPFDKQLIECLGLCRSIQLHLEAVSSALARENSAEKRLSAVS